jgi:hypothetical protein
MVLDGSFTLYNEFFDSHKYQAPEGGWNPVDFHSFSTEDLHWFYERGCTWKKILAEPGDLILWDSRTVHYGAHAEGDRPRVATCESPFPLPWRPKLKLRRVLQTRQSGVGGNHPKAAGLLCQVTGDGECCLTTSGGHKLTPVA